MEGEFVSFPPSTWLKPTPRDETIKLIVRPRRRKEGEEHDTPYPTDNFLKFQISQNTFVKSTRERSNDLRLWAICLYLKSRKCWSGSCKAFGGERENETESTGSRKIWAQNSSSPCDSTAAAS